VLGEVVSGSRLYDKRKSGKVAKRFGEVFKNIHVGFDSNLGGDYPGSNNEVMHGK